jgi:YhcH/YjgK/YiaL family protein
MVVCSKEGLSRFFSADVYGKIAAFLDGIRQDIATGKTYLDGEKLYASVDVYETKPAAAKDFETHDRYTDIQFLLQGRELCGWAPRQTLVEKTSYAKDRDIAFQHKPQSFETVAIDTERYVVFFPEDGHMPGLCDGAPHQVKKVVIKIAV